MDKKKLKKDIIISQHCQRNFDLTKTMPQEDIDLIIHSVTNCPSKQNLAFYDVVAITDRSIIEEIYEATLDKRGVRTNPQVLGSLLLVFTHRSPLDEVTPETKETSGMLGRLNRNMIDRNAEIEEAIVDSNESSTEKIKVDGNIALGIAAGYSTLVASQLGYRSGCSTCFQLPKIEKILESNGVKVNGKPSLLMGIGYNDSNRNRLEHHVTGKIIQPCTKVPIRVDYL